MQLLGEAAMGNLITVMIYVGYNQSRPSFLFPMSFQC